MSRAKNIALSALRLAGLRRAKPTTRLGKYFRTSERAVVIGVVLYFALICFPQPLFAYNVSAKGVTVYSRVPLPAETATRIDEALSLVRQSELAVPGRSERIFVCDQPWLFHLFAPISRGAFGISYPVSDNIFVAPSDLSRNVCRSSAPDHNRRTFSTVAAHEITHGLIRQRLGLLRGILLASWINEGYSDYVARESSFPEEEGLRNLREDKDDASGSFRYFVYRQMVRHLVEDRHLSFEEIAKRAGDSAAVKAETVAALKEATRP
jgi:hypothetical protein